MSTISCVHTHGSCLCRSECCWQFTVCANSFDLRLRQIPVMIKQTAAAELLPISHSMRKFSELLSLSWHDSYFNWQRAEGTSFVFHLLAFTVRTCLVCFFFCCKNPLETTRSFHFDIKRSIWNEDNQSISNKRAHIFEIQSVRNCLASIKCRQAGKHQMINGVGAAVPKTSEGMSII